MDVEEGDTREFEEVTSSVARNELDGTTRQEGMAIVSTTLESQAAFLSTAEAQTITTLTSQAQSAVVEVMFEDNSGLCKDATRVVKFITAAPLMSDRVDFCSQEKENEFKECNPELGLSLIHI